MSAARERYARKSEAEDLKRVFHKLDSKGDNKIDVEELQAIFAQYKHKVTKAEVEDMIWEVDEDCDKALTWVEFTAMYERCRNDTTGYEPRSLCNVVEFMMNDKDDSGTVTIDEATNHLYLRHGEALVDQALQDIFGGSDSGLHLKELNMTEFVKSLQKLQKFQIRSRLTPKFSKGERMSSSRKISSH